MCGPLGALAVASAAIGTALQHSGQRQAAKAANSAQEQNARDRMAATTAQRDARSAELARQDALQAEQRTLFNPNLQTQTAENREKLQADAAADRQALYDRAGIKAEIPFMGAAPAIGDDGSEPTVVSDNIGRVLADVTSRINQMRASKAALEGWGDANFGNNIGLNRTGQDIGLISGFRTGSNRAFGSEAQSIQDKLNADNDTMQARLLTVPYEGAGKRSIGAAFVDFGKTAATGAGNPWAPTWEDAGRAWSNLWAPNLPSGGAMPNPAGTRGGFMPIIS